ncbi:predicted protein [Plenodomus lingam JN3]|uniref:gamma-glutamylcyclotransferase n=1 Tax=Leptosphaeria maculans (strain JN3 / isolate v23.1.3 / race Av1-4-5-6-7-8) TaxID=985895 RepID=E4ZG53_LEPMJ|nr:predicted protein [Plenodomus lingam JN3]CBX90273.1 predicted protein [Plenodomus lingam JN3]
MTDRPAPLYKRLAARLQGGRRVPKKRKFPAISQTSQERLCESLKDEPFDPVQCDALQDPVPQEKEKTVLYLAYGSNLCKETFRGARGIRPLSKINVLVPSLRLTFDLPGIPYIEPCFANTAQRTPEALSDDDDDNTKNDDDDDQKGPGDNSPNDKAGSSDYHKNRWHKGLVGVVYEVTRRDYAHIISTEGGGSSYKDILVDCYVLPTSDTVPTVPDSQSFKAHTLFAPLLDDDNKRSTDRATRPDPDYAQPSARYLKLITDGAAECHLPQEYQDYLLNLRPYTITTKRQAVGKTLFQAIWLPFVMLIFTLAKAVQDKKGRAPWWYAKLTAWIFLAMWMSYDYAFKPIFGDGERTVGDEALWTKPKCYEDERAKQDYAENESLLEQSVESMNLHAKASIDCSNGLKNRI